jgi:hypothetical protein
MLKGEINLNKVAKINQNKVTGDYSKSWSKGSGSDTSDLREIVLWTHDRLWIVQSDTTEECTRWFNVLKALVTMISKTSASQWNQANYSGKD